MFDKEAIMAEVQDLATAAREQENSKPGKIEWQPAGGVAAPIFMGTSPVIPERYVLHFSETKCKACGTTTRDSEFFALSYLRSRINGSRVRHLTRCDSPQFNLPVDVVKLRTNVVPFCCECQSIDLSYLPPPPQAALVYDLAEPRLKGQKPREAKAEAKKPSTKATLDDLA